jgi:tetraacyldisaccharide 4'-kinase
LSLEQRITHAWQRDSLWLKLLLPLSWLFRGVSGLRRGYLQSRHQGRGFTVPVIIVGNISVGGSGKTPLIVALVKALKQRGFKPGVVSRGYGGKAASYPLMVNAQTAVAESGDEPLLIAQLAQCPLVVDADRRAAVAYLLSHHDCDVVLSDDGLQHYRLHRDIEIVVIDGQRGFGNGRSLPAGPLREGPGRLGQADFVVVNGSPSMALDLGDIRSDQMNIAPRRMTHLCSAESQPIGQWLQEHFLAEHVLAEHVLAEHLLKEPLLKEPLLKEHLLIEHLLIEQSAKPVHAVAAIGNPQRFANTLEQLGLDVELHGHDDHQALTAADLAFEDNLPVIITAKDGVKLVADDNSSIADNVWVLEIEAEIESHFIDRLTAQLQSLKTAD